MVDVVESRAAHWDLAYGQGLETRSWFQAEAAQSLRLIDRAAAARDRAVIDVGGGASSLVDDLLARGYSDVTVLDVSRAALDLARARLGEAASTVTWLCQDLVSWVPQRVYALWRDRAVFHFLTDPGDRAHYLRALEGATAAGSCAVLGCFAPDGPDHCSGLPVARYNAEGLRACLGPAWMCVGSDREEHHTPGGGMQPFTWVVLRQL
jgi:SAM-dependent methyltransferase